MDFEKLYTLYSSVVRLDAHSVEVEGFSETAKIMRTDGVGLTAIVETLKKEMDPLDLDDLKMVMDCYAFANGKMLSLDDNDLGSALKIWGLDSEDAQMARDASSMMFNQSAIKSCVKKAFEFRKHRAHVR